MKLTLAGVAQWIEHQPANQRVADSIHSQGTRLGCGSPVGRVSEATTHYCFSPSLSPSLPLSLKINKIFFKKGEINQTAKSSKVLAYELQKPS